MSTPTESNGGLGNSTILLISCNAELIEELGRLVAAASCSLVVRSNPAEAEHLWRNAALVLVESGQLQQCVQQGLPRRPGLILIAHESGVDSSLSAQDAGSGLPDNAGGQFWRNAFELGAESLASLPSDEVLLLDRLAELARPSQRGSLGQAGRVVAVLGACGGAGASLLSVATGLAAAGRGESALVVDGDPLGGGLDLCLGMERVHGVRWPALTLGEGRLGVRALQDGLPRRRVGKGELSVLSADRLNGSAAPGSPSSADRPEATAFPDGAWSEHMEQLGFGSEVLLTLLQTARRGFSTVLCDVPRPQVVGEVRAQVALEQADLVVVVVPTEVRAAVAAGQLLAWLKTFTRCEPQVILRDRRVAGRRTGVAPGALLEGLGQKPLATWGFVPGLAARVNRAGLRSTRLPGGRQTHRVTAAVLAELQRRAESTVDFEQQSAVGV